MAKKTVGEIKAEQKEKKSSSKTGGTKKKTGKPAICQACGGYLDERHTAAMCQMNQNIFHASMGG